MTLFYMKNALCHGMHMHADLLLVAPSSSLCELKGKVHVCNLAGLSLDATPHK